MADFKSLNGYMVKDAAARDELAKRLIYPSGDQTGEQDWLNIWRALSNGGVATLAAGEFYLSQPLTFSAGKVLRGAGVRSTIINTTTDFIKRGVTGVSLDYITVSDLTVNGTPGYIGIDIRKDTTAETETGGRYATFRNLHIQGFSTCLYMSGAWCVDVDKCRFEAVQQCVKQEGSCNNVNYTNCMFLGVQDQTYGVKIDAAGGAQNCGVTFNNCDFERHIEAIHAYCVIGLTIKDIYAEGIQRVFHVDSCPNFYMHGGYVTFPTDKLGNVTKSNNLPVYGKGELTISGVYVRYNKDTESELITCLDGCVPTIRDMRVVNDGGGIVYATHIDRTQAYTYGGSGATFTVACGVCNPISFNAPDFGPFPARVTAAEKFKLIKVEIVFDADVPHTGDEYTTIIIHNSGTWVASATVNKNHATYKNGESITLGFDPNGMRLRMIEDIKDLTFTTGTNVTDTNRYLQFHAKLTFGRGEFVLYE